VTDCRGFATQPFTWADVVTKFDRLVGERPGRCGPAQEHPSWRAVADEHSGEGPDESFSVKSKAAAQELGDGLAALMPVPYQFRDGGERRNGFDDGRVAFDIDCGFLKF
jgi:hypothetical protein